MLQRFTDWTDSINPLWVGIVVFVSALLLVLFVFIAAIIIFIVLCVITNGTILLSFVPILLYAWYVALFRQK